ncbi:ARL14 effector protein isoform X2 [Hippocampus comes]|uniref:ARL14 effector protein isoform X2 n=1 Tax=Hippocampus comes TaxID=109280 RepID=UPI00094EC51B|nr:PREDICTED: ARL14 effector protein isoform X2 [Hippocampus comes]
MPVTCASLGCNNKFVKGSDIRFYRFPLSKPSLSARWVQSLGLRNFIPTANTCLCSEHFSPDCFRDYNGKQFLREDAVPSLFPHGQDSSKETSVTNNLGPQAERDKAREMTNLRREKRGGARGGRGGRGGKLSDRQFLGGKSRVYDSKGRLLSNGKDLCDCLDVDCMGCFYPCSDCSSRKCGFECRCDRKWLYEQMEVEGGEIIRNKFAF